MRSNRRIIHLINPFKVATGNSSYLDIAQPLTFESMRRAKQYFEQSTYKSSWTIELCTVQYPEDRSIIPDYFSILPDLNYSTQDYFPKEATGKKLPLLRDLLHGVHVLDLQPRDIIIFTNVDIALQKDFYKFVVESLVSYDAFVINRRDIPKGAVDQAMYTVADIEKLYTIKGKKHPGFDCFVFPYAALGSFNLGDVFLGYPPIGSVLKLNMENTIPSFHVFREEYMTFHLGEDIAWRKDTIENTSNYYLNIQMAKEAGFDFKPMKLL